MIYRRFNPVWVFQMDLAAKLTAFEVPVLRPKIPIRELVEPAKITYARRVRTRFDSTTIMLEILMPNGELRVTFLPSRFTHILTNEDIQQLCDSKQYSVKCTGSVGNSPNVLIFKH